MVNLIYYELWLYWNGCMITMLNWQNMLMINLGVKIKYG